MASFCPRAGDQQETLSGDGQRHDEDGTRVPDSEPEPGLTSARLRPEDD